MPNTLDNSDFQNSASAIMNIQEFLDATQQLRGFVGSTNDPESKREASALLADLVRVIRDCLEAARAGLKISANVIYRLGFDNDVLPTPAILDKDTLKAMLTDAEHLSRTAERIHKQLRDIRRLLLALSSSSLNSTKIGKGIPDYSRLAAMIYLHVQTWHQIRSLAQAIKEDPLWVPLPVEDNPLIPLIFRKKWKELRTTIQGYNSKMAELGATTKWLQLEESLPGPGTNEVMLPDVAPNLVTADSTRSASPDEASSRLASFSSLRRRLTRRMTTRSNSITEYRHFARGDQNTLAIGGPMDTTEACELSPEPFLLVADDTTGQPEFPFPKPACLRKTAEIQPPLPIPSDPCSEATTSSNSTAAVFNRLQGILGEKILYRRLLGSRGVQAEKILDLFQTVLECPEIGPDISRNMVVAMQRLSRVAKVYPTSYMIEKSQIKLFDNSPTSYGGFADVYKGLYRDGDYEWVVCLKVIRRFEKDQPDPRYTNIVNRVEKEAILWRQLSHPNLLPFYGMTEIQSRPCLVSPWMENGHVGIYVRRHENVARIPLALDIIEALKYLHECSIIHGDLKAANVLVDNSGRARVADFGLSSVTDPSILHWTSVTAPASIGGTYRWQAPELVSHDVKLANTPATDIYAWACVCYEIFTGELPYYDCTDLFTIIKKAQGCKPTKPSHCSDVWTSTGLTEEIWSLMDACWERDPNARPNTSTLGSALSRIAPKDDRPAQSNERPSFLIAKQLPDMADIETMLGLEPGVTRAA